MTNRISLLVVEGALEIPVSLKMLRSARISTTGLFPINKGGRIKFWKDASKYNQAAARVGYVFGLADLESQPCPSGLIQTHLAATKHPRFILRVAERMLESWLLADSPALADFLQIPESHIPKNPDAEANPKQTLVNLARRSHLRTIKQDLIPDPGSAGVVGKGYTPRMTQFIESYWRPMKASSRSESLRKAMFALRKIASSTSTGFPPA